MCRFFDRLYHRSPVRPNMRYVPIRLKKRRSTAALHNVIAGPRAEFSLASWSAAVFRRSWIVGSLLRDIHPTDPQGKIRILVGFRSKTSLNRYTARPHIHWMHTHLDVWKQRKRVPPRKGAKHFND